MKLDLDKKMAAQLSPEDIIALQNFVDEKMIRPGKAIPSKKIYALVKGFISNKNITDVAFAAAFSASVRCGLITGIEGRRKAGFVPLSFKKPAKAFQVKEEVEEEDPIEEEAVLHVENTATSPEEAFAKAKTLESVEKKVAPQRAGYKFAHHIWVGRKMYKTYRTFRELEEIIYIFNGTKKSGGGVTFNGEQYDCQTPFFEKFLTSRLVGAAFYGESDPILNDGTGIPVELRI